MPHMPGPWIVNPENDYAVLTGDGKWHVAQTFSDYECEGDGASDAQLIAAAPELLEACKAILTNHDDVARCANFERCGCADCALIRPVVDKAEGRPANAPDAP